MNIEKLFFAVGTVVLVLFGFLTIHATPASNVGTGILVNKLASTTNSVVLVGTTSATTVLSPNSARTYCLIENNSTNTVYMYLGSPAAVGRGIVLASTSLANNTYEINLDHLWTGTTSAISANGFASLTYVCDN